MKNMKLDKLAKDYILSCIDASGHDEKIEINTPEKALGFLYKTFKDEYGWTIERYGEYKAFTEWLQGLPSSFNIEFENYAILQLAIKWESLPKDYDKSFKGVRKADKILDNWFNFITAKTFQLFRKYKVN